MSYDWGKTEHNMTEPNAWQAVGGTIWTSEDNRPLKPQWHGLTDEEINAGMDRAVLPVEMQQAFGAGARWAEAKLREKNT